MGMIKVIGIGPGGKEDILDMFYEYRDMLAEGRKKAEIRDFLSNKHKLSASTIKRVIKRLNDEYKL